MSRNVRNVAAPEAPRMTKDRILYLKIRGCLMKKKFTEEKAKHIVATNKRASAYACKFCGQWHTTVMKRTWKIFR